MSKDITQWEYKLVKLNYESRWLGLYKSLPHHEVSALLSELGLLGWELCNERVDSNDASYIFKRLKTKHPRHE